jgi:hypothetical protein
MANSTTLAAKRNVVRFEGLETPLVTRSTDGENAKRASLLSKLFGGAYTTQEVNQVTGTYSCPIGFDLVSLVDGFLTVCEKFPGSDGDQYAVPFGGFFTGETTKDSSTVCPKGHSSYLLGIYQGIPWYVCMGINTQFNPPVWKSLPQMTIPSYVITVDDVTVYLTSSKSVAQQMMNKGQVSNGDGGYVADPNVPIVIGLSAALGVVMLAIIVTLVVVFIIFKRKSHVSWFGSTSINDHTPLTQAHNDVSNVQVL